MEEMRSLSLGFATFLYRQAARASAGMLGRAPGVESVLLHRSVATGEVDFGRSDIDMLLVLGERETEGASLAALFDVVRRARRLNPALNHIDVYEPGGLASHGETDTFWASVERRSLTLLRGQPVELPAAAVSRDHALSKFVLWVEWFFAIAVQQRNRRNLWKTALESWNAYAVAEGLIPQPRLLRSEMEGHACAVEKTLLADRLREPSYAVRFVFGLADRMHGSRLPALRKLAKPLIFEAVTAPLCLPRLFVVLPASDHPLPAEACRNGAFPCTPELLNLFVHTKNAFLFWALPPAVHELGIEPPSVAEFLSSCRYYGDTRFLTIPGFASPGPSRQAARMALIRHALDCALRDKLPPAVSQERIRETMTGAPGITEYYRFQYEGFLRESRRFQESLRALSRSSAGS